MMLGVIGTLALVGLAVVATAVFAVLFFRRNKNKQAQAEAVVDKISKKL